jgi:5-methyltetrahydrofolate--homocysteine methyltransferase
MHELLSRIESGEVLLGDGALGTQLFARGLVLGEPPESWNLTRPEALEEVARGYLDAGADLITTNTFGGSPLKLARHGLEGRVAKINRAAVAAVRRARDASGRRAFVFGSIGPCGSLLQPYGDADPDAVRSGYETQIRVLAEAGVDAIGVETMTDLTEATLAVRAAKAVAPGLPVLATMTFDRTPRGFFTIMGVTIARAAAGLHEAGADVVGSNCGNGIEAMVEIAREFRRHTPRPLLIQSNAGLPEIVDGQTVYRETPEFMAEKARELIAIGVSVIGGCCGTTPEHIAALRRILPPR